MGSEFRRTWHQFVGLFPTAGDSAAPADRPPSVLRPLLHVLVVLACCVALYFGSRALKLGLLVEDIGDFWLPTLFLLFYAFVWVAFWLWQLWTGGDQETSFADIDKAWETAVLALEANRLSLKRLPMFLILGEPASGERALFRAVGLPLLLNQTPRENAPLHLYATEQAIYLCCSGLSLLTRMARHLAGSDPDSLPDPNQAARTLTFGNRTVTFGNRDLPRLRLLGDPQQIEDYRRRLHYLCRLIVRSRYPLCPANGILVVLPFEAVQSKQVAADTGYLCQKDLESVRQGLRQLCPRVVLIGNLERAPAYQELTTGFWGDQEPGKVRIGQGLPLNPYLGRSKLTPQQLVESLATWLHRDYLPWILLGRGAVLEDRPEKLRSCLAQNAECFALLDQLHEGEPNLGHLLWQGLVENIPNPWLIRGCYYAGTGLHSEEQVFANRVLSLLTEHQGAVRWTDEVRQEEAWCDWWASFFRGLALVLGLVLVGVVVLIALYFRRLGGY